MGSNPNIKPSNDAVLAGIFDPDAYAAGTYTSGWVDMGNYDSLQAIIAVGDMVATATLDAKLEQATSSGGAGAKDITVKAITQLTQAGTDDNKQAIINCRSDEIDVAGGFRYVRLSCTLGTAGADLVGLILGHNARWQPAADLATVDEVVG
jgi:hypothetical protein